MRATLRITWFLFSLSLLFDSICSDDSPTNPPVIPGIISPTPLTTASMPSVPGAPRSTVQTETRVNTVPVNTVPVNTVPVNTVPVNTVPVNTVPVNTVPVNTVPVNTVPVNTVPVTDKAVDVSTAAKTSVSTNQNVVTTQKTTNPSNPPTPVGAIGSVSPATATSKPAPTQPQPVLVISNLPPTAALPTSRASPVMVYSSAATSSVPNIMTPPAKVSSRVSTGSPTRPSTVKTPEPGLNRKTPEVSTKLPLDLSSNETFVTTKGSTNSQTTQPGRGNHILSSPTVSPADPKAGTKETLPTSQGPTPFKTTMPAATPTSDLQTRQPEPVGPTVRTPPRQTSTTSSTSTTSTTSASPKKFIYSLLSEQATKEEEDLAQVCRLLMPNWLNGTCALTWRRHNGKVQFDLVEINGKVKTSQAALYYEEITKKPTDNRTLIAILASCGALLIMIVILAVCASHHRKPYHHQQHLTEELHTVENGYHDNPTLEVMEVQPEMQEKKMALNGEFNDSWIVPMDNLLKEELPDEEDTHL